MKLPLYLLALSCASLQAQGGSLTPPPGSPAPSMKSLDQVEARTPLVEGAAGVTIDAETGGITISESGSYYLTGNLSVTGGNGITITSNRVTLNLNGFLISSTANPAEGHGISSISQNLSISNGTISGGYNLAQDVGPGFEGGIGVGSLTGRSKITDIIVSNCSSFGISAGISPISLSTIASCQVNNVGGTGIVGSHILDCSVVYSKDKGIQGHHVTNCKVFSREGNAIEAESVSNCHATSVDGDGIVASVVSNCFAHSHEGTGIRATNLVSYSEGRFSPGNEDEFGIVAKTAIGCHATKISVTNKYLMP